MEPLRFDFPVKDQFKQPLPTLELLVFGAQGDDKKASREALCRTTMKRTNYTCLASPEDECWFAWRRTPTEGGGATCSLLYRQADGREEVPEVSPDAAPDVSPDRAPDRLQEAKPEPGCREGARKSCYTGPSGTQGKGACQAGAQTCKGGQWGPCQGEVTPRKDVCDGVDNDCDGQIDERPECGSCPEGEMRSCYSGPAGTAGNGICKKGTQLCQKGSWTSCSDDVIPVPEVCNGKVDDPPGGCSRCRQGQSRTCYPGDTKTKGVGECRQGRQVCQNGQWGDCVGVVLPRIELCDNLDNDCNGSVDERCVKRCLSPPCVYTLLGPQLLRAGPRAHPWLSEPRGVVFDGNKLYIADARHHAIYTWSPRTPQVVAWFAGSGRGNKDGTTKDAQFDQPHGLAFGPGGDLFVADYGNKRIRKIDTKGNVTTLTALSSLSDGPKGIAVGAKGTIFIADTDSHSIVFGKEGGPVKRLGKRGLAGFNDKLGKEQFNQPHGLVFDGMGNLYVADTRNHAIRKISLDKTTPALSTFAGTPQSAGFRDGQRTVAKFTLPIGLAFDAKGTLYIGDSGNHRIRKITRGLVSTLVGKPTQGQVDGVDSKATLSSPLWLAATSATTGAELFFSEPSQPSQPALLPKIRRVNLDGIAINVRSLIGASASGRTNGARGIALFKQPKGLLFDVQGSLLIADSGNHMIRKMDVQGRVSTFSGTGTLGDNAGAASRSTFAFLSALVPAPVAGFLAVDGSNHIREVTSIGATSFYAGSKPFGLRDGPRKNALFHGVSGIVRTKDDKRADVIYVVERGNHCIRKIDSTGQVSTFAGIVKGTTCERGYTDGPGGQSRFSSPNQAAADNKGNLYITDTSNHRIRKITPTGKVSTLAGDPNPGYLDGAAATAKFFLPIGIVVDGSGNVYVADTGNHAIRKIDTKGLVSTVAGDCSKTRCFPGLYDGAAKGASFLRPEGLLIDSNGDLLVADTGNHRIRRIRLK